MCPDLRSPKAYLNCYLELQLVLRFRWERAVDPAAPPWTPWTFVAPPFASPPRIPSKHRPTKLPAPVLWSELIAHGQLQDFKFEKILIQPTCGLSELLLLANQERVDSSLQGPCFVADEMSQDGRGLGLCEIFGGPVWRLVRLMT